MTKRRAYRALDRVVRAESLDELLACPPVERAALYEVLREAHRPGRRWQVAAAAVARRRGVTPAYVMDRALAVLATAAELRRHDLYALLGVCPGVGVEDLRRRWRELAKHYHPDNGEMPDPRLFMQLRAAWTILADPVQRLRYDEAWCRRYGPILSEIAAPLSEPAPSADQAPVAVRRQWPTILTQLAASVAAVVSVTAGIGVGVGVGRYGGTSVARPPPGRRESQTGRLQPRLPLTAVVEGPTAGAFVVADVPMAPSGASEPRVDILPPNPRVAVAGPHVELLRSAVATRPEARAFGARATDVNPGQRCKGPAPDPHREVRGRIAMALRPAAPAAAIVTTGAPVRPPREPVVAAGRVKDLSWVRAVTAAPVDLAAARRVLEQYRRRYARGEPLGLFELFAGDATANGRRGVQIAEAYADTFQRRGRAHIEFEPIHFAPTHVETTVRARFVVRYAEKPAVRGEATFVLRRDEGRVRVAHLVSTPPDL